jgi:hypothetical protein
MASSPSRHGRRRTHVARAALDALVRLTALVAHGSAASLVVSAALLAAAPAEAAPEGVLWQTAPDTPFSFTRFDAEWSPTTKRVYFLGGRLPDGTTDGSVWSFDPETGVYSDTTTDMPVPVSNYNIARLVDAAGAEVMMIFGGRPEAGGVVNTVQGYYPGTNSSTTFALDPYPALTAPGGVAVVDNLAWSFGGFDAAAMIDDTYVFDITAAEGSRWTPGPDLTLARSYVGAAVVDGLIYAVGGATWDGVALHAVQIVERLDPSNPTAWDDASVADLPQSGPGPDFGCDEMQTFGFDTGTPYDLEGAIVMAGCGQWPLEIVESMRYDVAADAWDAPGFPDLNLVRRNHAGAFVPFGGGADGRPGVWVWGGRFESDTTLRTTPEFYAVGPALLFADGFESGDDSAWSFVLP